MTTDQHPARAGIFQGMCSLQGDSYAYPLPAGIDPHSATLVTIVEISTSTTQRGSTRASRLVGNPLPTSPSPPGDRPDTDGGQLMPRPSGDQRTSPTGDRPRSSCGRTRTYPYPPRARGSTRYYPTAGCERRRDPTRAGIDPNGPDPRSAQPRACGDQPGVAAPCRTFQSQPRTGGDRPTERALRRFSAFPRVCGG